MCVWKFIFQLYFSSLLVSVTGVIIHLIHFKLNPFLIQQTFSETDLCGVSSMCSWRHILCFISVIQCLICVFCLTCALLSKDKPEKLFMENHMDVILPSRYSFNVYSFRIHHRHKKDILNRWRTVFFRCSCSLCYSLYLLTNVKENHIVIITDHYWDSDV